MLSSPWLPDAVAGPGKAQAVLLCDELLPVLDQVVANLVDGDRIEAHQGAHGIAVDNFAGDVGRQLRLLVGGRVAC